MSFRLGATGHEAISDRRSSTWLVLSLVEAEDLRQEA
jgi:hypothetical protein